MRLTSTRALALLVAAAACVPTSARADQVDKKLDAAMPGVVAQLKKKGYKNVGTLRFSVKQPGKQATYATVMSGSLATRVENMLVIHGGPKSDYLNVIRDASKTARDGKVGAWPTAVAERRKLFNLDYPLAWVSPKVKADAFLTGQAELSKDMRTTTVKLQVIDRKTAAISDLATVKAETGVQVLRDLGISYELGARSRSRMIAKRSTSRDINRLTMNLIGGKKRSDDEGGSGSSDDGGSGGATGGDPDPSDGKTGDEVKPTNLGEVTVEMELDGKKVEFTPNSAEGDNAKLKIESPKPGQAIAFRLRNNSEKRRAVVIHLNGVNLINQQPNEPESCGKFILEPKGQPKSSTLVKGFVMVEGGEGEDKPGAIHIVPFKVLTGEEAKTRRDALGPKSGRIDVFVFEEGEGAGSSDMQVSLRGLPRRQEQKARQSRDSYRLALARSAGKKIEVRGKGATARELIVDDTEKKVEVKGGIAVVKFNVNPQPIGQVFVRVVPAEANPD